MIRTVAELFEAMRDREVARLRQIENVGHAGMIGDMFEGLSRELLRQVIPESCDIRVVDGKVRNSDGTLSGQMDVMVVQGEGEPLPYTSHFIYPERRVLAVFEVKKTLTGEELRSAIDGLKSVGKPTDDTPALVQALRGPFHLVLGVEAPTSEADLDRMSSFDEMVSYSLISDAMRPVRIVLGYDGFRTERGVREALLKYLELNSPSPGSPPTRGFGPADLPNLVLCNHLALVKLNGMPFAARIGEKEAWACLGSAHESSGALLLEVLWTRLQSFNPEISTLLGDDLTIETTYPLLLARVGSVMVDGHEHRGWMYEVVDRSETELKSWNPNAKWEPAPITPDLQATIVFMARRGGVLDLHDPEIRSELEAVGDLDAHIEMLLGTGLLWLDKQRWLRSLADNIVTVFLPDGRMAAANQSDPRFVRWIEQQG
ncbi:MAG: DUF6602 domain-containing protein [Gemmatimonadaceae bacterium]